VTAPILSASQVNTYRDCARKWAISYLDVIKPPGNASAELGKAVHAELETYTKSGTKPTSPIALAALPHIPQPGIAQAEQEFAHTLPSSAFRGFIDGLFDTIDDTAVAPFTGDATTVLDYKTSSDPRKWGKTPEQLRTDVQANLYASWAFSKGAHLVNGLWLYLPTKGKPIAHPVRLAFDRAQVADVVESIDCTAKEVQALYQIRPKSHDVTPNRKACNAFGGCPHRNTEHCQPPALEELFMSDNNGYGDFLADIAARTGGQVPGQPAAVPPPPPVFAAKPATVPPPPPAYVPASPADALRPGDRHGMVAPAPVAIAAKPWEPGDPMNITQEFLSGAGASIAMIANAADVPPTPEVAQSYTTAKAPRNVHELDAAAARFLPPALRPPVESGFINPPQAAGMVAPLTPEELQAQAPAPLQQTVQAPAPSISNGQAPDDLDLLSRDAVKALGVSLGAFDASCRYQLPRMKDEIRKVRAADSVERVAVTADMPTESRESKGILVPEGFDITETTLVHDGDVVAVPPPLPIMRVALPAPIMTPEPADAAQVEMLRAALPSASANLLAAPSVFEQGFTLYLNCAPAELVGVMYFESVLRVASAKVRELCEGDWRGGSKASDYGKGAIVLANVVHAHLETLKPSALVVDGRTPEALACMSVLTGLSSTIVRGF